MIKKAYEEYGIEENIGELDSVKHLRNILINLACQSGYSPCLSDTAYKLKELISGDIKGFPVDTEAAIFCNGIIKGGDEEQNFVLELLIRTTDSKKRIILIRSLGCMESEDHLNKFIKYILVLDFYWINEIPIVIEAVYSHSYIGLQVALEFLNTSGEFLKKR